MGVQITKAMTMCVVIWKIILTLIVSNLVLIINKRSNKIEIEILFVHDQL